MPRAMGIRKRAGGRGSNQQTYQGIQQSIKRQARHLLTTGRRFERFDQLRQRHFWSTAYYATDANGYITGPRQVFITPPGQNGQGFPSGVSLTERETNWKSANRVPDNQNFEITEIGVGVGVVVNEVDSDTSAAVRAGQVLTNFLQNTVVSITYLTNSVPLGLAGDFAQAAAPFGGTFRTTDDGATTVEARTGSNGFPAPALRRRFKIPILLQHGETFSFQFDIPRAVYNGLDTTIYARLDFWATESFAEKS